ASDLAVNAVTAMLAAMLGRPSGSSAVLERDSSRIQRRTSALHSRAFDRLTAPSEQPYPPPRSVLASATEFATDRRFIAVARCTSNAAPAGGFSTTSSTIGSGSGSSGNASWNEVPSFSRLAKYTSPNRSPSYVRINSAVLGHASVLPTQVPAEESSVRSDINTPDTVRLVASNVTAPSPLAAKSHKILGSAKRIECA